MNVIITILLTLIGTLLGILCWFLYRIVTKVDTTDKTVSDLKTQFAAKFASSEERENKIAREVAELSKSSIDISKEFGRIQLIWEDIKSDWQTMKSIILLK